MTKQVEFNLPRFPRKDKGISAVEYRQYLKETRYPAIHIVVSDNNEFEVQSNKISADEGSICIETMTIAEVITALNTMGITAELMSPGVAAMPATLLEDFISRKTIIETCNVSPFKYRSLYSDIIDNVPASRIPTSYNIEVIGILNNKNEPQVIEYNDVGDIDLGYLDSPKKAIINTYVTDFVLFVNKEKISSTHSIASNLDDNYLKYQLLTSLTVNNSSIL